MGKRYGTAGAVKLFKHRAGIAFMVAISFCSHADAGTGSFQSFMDDGRSADLVQHFQQAETDYSMAYQLAQKSNSPHELFDSLAHLLCSMIVQQKYQESEPLYVKLNALAIELNHQKKLEIDMIEDIDDICDAYEAGDRLVKSAPDPNHFSRLEHSLKLRVQFVQGTTEMISDENRLIEWHMRNHEFAKAQELLALALSHSAQMQPVDVATFQLLQSCIYDKTGDTQKAAALQRSALAKCTQLNALGDYYVTLAWFHSRFNELKLAIKYDTQAIKIYENPLRALPLTDALTQRADWEYAENNLNAAEADFQRALTVAKKSPACWREISPCYHGLGNVMLSRHNEKQAAQYFVQEKEANQQARKLERKDFHDVSGDFEAAKRDWKSEH